MAVQPIKTAAISTAVGSAVTPNGNGGVVTTKVTNAMQGDKELEMTFAASSAADISNLKIFMGAWAKDSELALPEGVTFTCAGFGDDIERVRNYFKVVSTNVYGIRLETTDVTNYQSTLNFTEKDPTGKENLVKKTLSKYRVPVGNGYSETIELNESDLNSIQWPALEVAFSKLKKSSSVTLYFKVRGWNKAQDLSPLQADIIG